MSETVISGREIACRLHSGISRDGLHAGLHRAAAVHGRLQTGVHGRFLILRRIKEAL